MPGISQSLRVSRPIEKDAAKVAMQLSKQLLNVNSQVRKNWNSIAEKKWSPESRARIMHSALKGAVYGQWVGVASGAIAIGAWRGWEGAIVGGAVGYYNPITQAAGFLVGAAIGVRSELGGRK